ncbi:hypothetical protein [Arthrobacter alpinus]|uniref:hypothetical protein n=1 Tax=Arthrobacter alpinus TaxID=656366 RepID=UPI000AA2346C|nr:hypothetical protein [Arthrobacter alpinus]
MSNENEAARRAENYADQAAATASKLKPGNWEAVQALATLSIAESLLARGSRSQENS